MLDAAHVWRRWRRQHKTADGDTGKQADLSVLEIKDGDWMLYDILGDSRKSDKAVLPVMAIKKGEVFEAGWGPRPWGWEPDLASSVSG